MLGDDVDFPVFDVVGAQDSVTMFESLVVGGFDVVTETSPLAAVVPPHQLGEVDGLFTGPLGDGRSRVGFAEFEFGFEDVYCLLDFRRGFRLSCQFGHSGMDCIHRYVCFF